MLNFTLQGQNYQIFVTGQKLWIPNQQIHIYPDVMVVATPLEFPEGQNDIITNPLMIADVFSKSNQSGEKSEKFAAYCTIPTFKEYLLIDEQTMHVEHYFKIDDKHWIFKEYENAEVTITLASIPFEFLLADIYNNVDFNLESLESS